MDASTTVERATGGGETSREPNRDSDEYRLVRKRPQLLRSGFIAAVIAVTTIPAAAVAAIPKMGTFVGRQVEMDVRESGPSEPGNTLGTPWVISMMDDFNAKHRAYCGARWWTTNKVISVRRSGRFYFKGNVEAPTGTHTFQRYGVIEGQFTTPRKVVGTLQLRHCAKTSFVATN